LLKRKKTMHINIGRTSYKIILCTILVFFNSNNNLQSWGFFGHKLINKMAVYTLPPEIIGFYKRHIDYITEHAIDPDKRRGFLAEEGARHYIDLDHYKPDPYTILPMQWNDAVKKMSEDTLMAYGINPWYVEKMVSKLTFAFKEENLDRVLKYSADLGHYIADGHVPLHTTENYNGQLTNQKGIHGFWESRVPELLSNDYDFFIGKAIYVNNVNELAWKTIKESHAAVDSVLGFEAKLNNTFEADQKYSIENRGAANIKTYSEAYTKKYSEMLGNQVERRMRKSIITVGSLWFTAWVNAGQPNLERLDNKQVSDSLRKAEQEAEYLWNNGKQKINSKGHED
jgi:hypothetical protein